VNNGEQQFPAMNADGAAVDLDVDGLGIRTAMPEVKDMLVPHAGPGHFCFYLFGRKRINVLDVHCGERCAVPAIEGFGSRIRIEDIPVSGSRMSIAV